MQAVQLISGKMLYKKFVYVVDGDICGTIEFSVDGPEDIELAKGLLANPNPIEVPMETEVMIGWIYDGKNFTSN